MRTRRVLLLTGLAAAVSAISAAAAPASSPPGAAYAWSQPGCVPAVTCCANPSFAVGPFMLSMPAAGATYAWAQPDAAPVTTPYAQPVIG